ncbi:metal-dependent hydrolase [Desulfovibrio inopinatus]|uniref:metal-dependent hydrolase n=1 Tax=Desulfovibrio inopinatus TaxID=102109 RepID=UPI0004888007|nr:metal-dependent hydrolase [Desulfovibrio inopinatus]
MPGYRTHIFGALVAGAAVLAGLYWLGRSMPSIEMCLFLAVLVVLGGLFPDVDTDSKGQNLFYLALVGLDLYLIFNKQYRYAALLGFCALLPALGPHRGWTHTLWAMALVPLPVLLVPTFFYGIPWQSMLPYYLAVVLGYFSHLALDRKFW